MKRLGSLFIFILAAHALCAQTVLENNPPRIRFNQINTPNFRIIFPRGFDQQAQRMANTMEHIRSAEAKSLGREPRKISVILQNQSSLSNGFVSITPRRSEFYTMPPQDYNFLGTNDWLNMLAAHEYRHMVQFQHANRGFNRLLYYLFGQNTLAGMSYAAVPQWFWEGDAVVTETAFTPSGRGRIPNFGLVFKTNLLEGREFNYHKQYLRSYKHNIPDHYVLGYYMVSHLRKKTGDPQSWSRITARSWGVPFIPFTFSNALKKESGMYVTGLYRDMVNELKQDWQKEISQLELTTFEKVNARTTTAYTDYLYPQPLDDGSVLTMKKGIGDIERFVRLINGREEKVFVPGIVNDAGMLSVANTKVVWSEYGYDPRWRVRNFSRIKGYDFGAKKLKPISQRGSRLSGAAISPDGYKVVALRSNESYQHNIVVVDYFSDKVLKEFANPENNFYSMARWSTDGRTIVALKGNTKGKSVVRLDYESGQETELLPSTDENIGHPVLTDKYLLFNSPVSGIDNIYAIELSSGQRYQVTVSKYGAYNPSVSRNGDALYYNDQTCDGLDVVKIPFAPSSWKVVEAKSGEPKSFFQYLVDQEGRPDLFKTVPSQQYPVTRYSKLKGILNPYAWGAYFNNDLTIADIGISSRDILNTTTVNLGYRYDINEETGSWRASVSYQGWYPIIDLAFTQGDRSVDEGDISIVRFDSTNMELDTLVRNLTFDWKEWNVEGGLRIPLITTNSKYIGNFTLGNSVGMTHVTGFRNSIDEFGRIVVYDTTNRIYFFRDYIDNGNLVYNHFSLSAYRLLKQSRRDINSKWGQAIYLNLYNTPFGGDFSGSQFSFYGLGYFPGLFRHHSLWGYWSFQKSKIENVVDNYIFRNQIPLPRGHSIIRRENLYSMSLNYTMPLWYPDIALGPILNIQRVRTNLFLDYAFGATKTSDGTVSESYTSVGGEVKFDFNIMRFLPQIDIGFRYSIGLTPSVTKFEVLIGTINF